MRIQSLELRRYLANELKTTGEALAKESDPSIRAFYFSAVYGAAQRVLNIEFSDEMALLAMVAQTTHTNFVVFMQAHREGKGGPFPLPDATFETLAQILGRMAGRVNENHDSHDLIAAMATIGYSATGNGSYLVHTGRIDIAHD